jgi:hypothetical protein
MPVFISHKKEDKESALKIAAYLKQHDILSYVDALDPTLQTTDDITKTLIDRISLCTHLMAVVSQYTEKSWWVPFEIGVGTEKDRRITSYQLTTVNLPDFLTKWPILKSQRDLDMFIKFYKQDYVVSLEEAYGYSRNIYSADQFHKQLKMSL